MSCCTERYLVFRDVPDVQQSYPRRMLESPQSPSLLVLFYTQLHTGLFFLSFAFSIFFPSQFVWLLACSYVCSLLCVCVHTYMHSFSPSRMVLAEFRRTYKPTVCRDTSPGEHQVMKWRRACCIHRHVRFSCDSLSIPCRGFGCAPALETAICYNHNPRNDLGSIFI